MTRLVFTKLALEQMERIGVSREVVAYLHDTHADAVTTNDGVLNLFSVFRGKSIRVTLDPFTEPYPLIIAVAHATERQIAA